MFTCFEFDQVRETASNNLRVGGEKEVESEEKASKKRGLFSSSFR